ncbi:MULTISPECIES: hypothetical protein [unclassified Sphingomonas]|uniref:hypothetical protein n=1 Tax=Sphingomonas sp. PvP015 TaxID=3156388 RepID=UPI0033919326
MKDYSGLLEIADASISKNDDNKLRTLTSGLRAMVELELQREQQRIADEIGKRIIELL